MEKEILDMQKQYEEIARAHQQEILDIMEKYHVMDNINTSRLNKADREKTEELIALSKENAKREITEIITKCISLAQENGINYNEKEQPLDKKKEPNNKLTERRVKTLLDKAMASVKRLTERFRDVKIAFENAVEKIKDDIKNGFREKMNEVEIQHLAKIDKNKIRASLKAIDAITIESRALNDVHRDSLLQEMSRNQKDIEKITQKVEKKYLEATRAREKAYSIDMIKTGFRMWGQTLNPFKKSDAPEIEFKTKEEFGMMPEKEDMAEIRSLLKDLSDAQNRHAELTAAIADGDVEQFKKECVYGYQFEPDDGIDCVRYNRAAEELRSVYAKENDTLKEYAEQGWTLENGDKAFDYGVDQLQQISLGMREGIDVSRYADPEIYADKMTIVRTMATYDCIPDDLTIDKIKELEPEALKEYAEEMFYAKTHSVDYVKEISGGDIDRKEADEIINNTYQYLSKDMDWTKNDMEIANVLCDIAKEMDNMMQERACDVEQILQEQKEQETPNIPEPDLDDDFDR